MDFMDMKKKGKSLSDREQAAKIKVIEAMRDEAASQMGSKLKGLKKVTVASNDETGLKAGLEKAKELIAGKAGENDDAESMEAEAEETLESPEEEASEEAEEMPESPMHSAMSASPESEDLENMSEEEIDAKLKELMAAKMKLSAQKG